MDDDRDSFWPEPLLDTDALGPDVVPEPPAWMAGLPGGDSVWQVPDCPCCVEPEPVREAWSEHQVKPVGGWAVPGVRFGEQAPLPALPGPSPLLAELQVLAARLVGVQASALPGPQALVDAQALLGTLQQLRVHSLDRLADVETRKLHDYAGFRSARAWISSAQPDTCSADLPLARKLRGFPHLKDRVEAQLVALGAASKVVAALGKLRRHVDSADGLIDGQPAGEVIAAVVRNVVDLTCRNRLGLHDDHPLLAQLVAATEQIIATAGSDLEQLEQAFTLLAEHVPASALADCLDEQVCAVLPNLLEDRAQRGAEQAEVHLQRNLDGSGWHLQAELDLECGELLFTLLAAEANRDPDNPDDTASAQALREQGLNPYDPDHLDVPDRTSLRWPRSKGRRLHDALKNLLQRYLGADLAGRRHKQPVRISVTVSTDVIDQVPGASPATAASGARLPRSLIQRWWCNASTTTFLLSRGWIPLGVQHTGRTLTATERQALDLQTERRCAGLGCCPGRRDDPTVTLEPHHVHAYAATGTTNVHDTIWACDTLHHDLHHGKTVQLRNGRYLSQHGWTTDPNGGRGTKLSKTQTASVQGPSAAD
ncbi:MAG: uncharacterized protein JWM02_2299 [Frankiales bacterium]|nr:uncharacterized protein [Frankiales bacterium]